MIGHCKQASVAGERRSRRRALPDDIKGSGKGAWGGGALGGQPKFLWRLPRVRWEPLEWFELCRDRLSHFKRITCVENVPWKDDMETRLPVRKLLT